jgi:hypothetical protein
VAARSVDRRRLVPGDLQHVSLEAGNADVDLFASIAALFGRRAQGKRLVCTPLTVETWGIADFAAGQQVTPWAKIVGVAHRKIERGSGDSRQAYSQVDVELDDRILRGERAYEVMLELLAEEHPRLAVENRRPIALGLDGAATSERAHAGLFGDLLGRARAWLQSDDGLEATTQVGGDYRVAERKLDPGFLAELEVALVDAPGRSERGPFAAIVAAELRLGALEDALAALTSSPQPFVAAVAIGAALRLGVSPIRVGKVARVEPYIDADASRAITTWGAGG